MNFSLRNESAEFLAFVNRVTAYGSQIYFSQEGNTEEHESFTIQNGRDCILVEFQYGQLTLWVYEGVKLSGNQITEDKRMKAAILRDKIREIWKV